MGKLSRLFKRKKKIRIYNVIMKVANPDIADDVEKIANEVCERLENHPEHGHQVIASAKRDKNIITLKLNYLLNIHPAIVKKLTFASIKRHMGKHFRDGIEFEMKVEEFERKD